MTKNSPGWAIELLGEKIDLDDLRESLPSPFDPCVEDFQDGETTKAILRSANWSRFTAAADVVRDARGIIERLNGELLLIHTDAQPVKVGGIMKFDPGGKRENILFAATGHVDVRLNRVRGRAKVTTGVSQASKESPLQKWFREAEADDVRAELFSHERK